MINYNGKKWLHQCLRSISTISYPNFDICLIDNASTDGSIEYVQDNFPSIRIIKFDTNFGFAKGYNYAINQIKADYILLLNNDTKILKPDFLDNIVNQAQKDLDIAAIVCKMVFMSDTNTINSVGGIGIPYWRGFEDIGFREKDVGQYDVPPIEPFSFCGGATLIRLKAFIETLGFDETFFAFFEDTDLSWRFRLKKLKIKYVPDSKIAHQYSGTYSEGPEKTYLCKRNLFRSILKNCGSPTIYWAIRNYLLFSILASISYLKVERAPLMAWALFKSILWNLWHLPGTYNKRQIIQNERKTNDKEILSRMYPSKLLKRREINSFGDRIGERIFGYLPKNLVLEKLSSSN